MLKGQRRGCAFGRNEAGHCCPGGDAFRLDPISGAGLGEEKKLCWVVVRQGAQSRKLSAFERWGKGSDFIAAFRQMDSSSNRCLKLSYECKLRITFCRQVQKEVLCVRSDFILKATSRQRDTFNSNRDKARCQAGNYWGTCWKFYQICFVLARKHCLAFEETLIWIWGISVFQRSVLSSIVSLCFSLLQGQAVRERGFSMWSKDTEGSITAAFLDISVTDCRCSLIKANIMEKKNLIFIHLYCEPQLPGHVSFGNAYFGVKSSGFSVQFFKCQIFSWIQWPKLVEMMLQIK